MTGARAVIDTLIATSDDKNADGEQERQKKGWFGG